MRFIRDPHEVCEFIDKIVKLILTKLCWFCSVNHPSRLPKKIHLIKHCFLFVFLKEIISIPHFTAEGVSAVTKWALLALFGYYLLYFLLRVTVGLVRRVFWLVKPVVVVWLFVRIVSDPIALPEVTTMRLTLLVLICAVFAVAASSGEGRNGSLESRISRLEGQVNGTEKKTRQ